ncbi:hypothetical protein [uncultured Duncaniella sp.]|uniref:hypothetical protein n=1 Tax=uncultured Duncaniella sp. TaxID=2768039 RepID=UPI00261AD265|nr:hypothetical protein [uncultured Duncaniella sp.]
MKTTSSSSTNSTSYYPVDYGDPRQVCAYWQRMITLCQNEGGLDTPSPTSDTLAAIRTDCRKSLSEVDNAYPAYTSGDKIRVMAYYDLIYRIAYGHPTPVEMLKSRRNHIIEAWLGGDQTITETAVASMIQHHLRIAPKTVDHKHILWYNTVIAAWCDELLRHPSTPHFRGLTPTESSLRLSILLTEDLTPILGPDTQHRYKQHWAKAERMEGNI